VPKFFLTLNLNVWHEFMDQAFLIVAVFLVCYFLGSIPTAVWTGKLFFGVDVRTQGSGNAGATNTFRVLGKGAGTFVLAFDITKGYLASSLALFLSNQGLISSENILLFKMLMGLTAVTGHIYPIFAGFKGGKGVATLLGMVFSISMLVAMVCLAVFLLFFISFHYVSVGSLMAGIVFSLLIFSGLAGEAPVSAKILSVFLTTMLFYTHRSNIQKLRMGTENKMYLTRKKTNT
jgi:glycerol-3-phosphate acyltransferase PlsY